MDNKPITNQIHAKVQNIAKTKAAFKIINFMDSFFSNLIPLSYAICDRKLPTSSLSILSKNESNKPLESEIAVKKIVQRKVF